MAKLNHIRPLGQGPWPEVRKGVQIAKFFTHRQIDSLKKGLLGNQIVRWKMAILVTLVLSQREERERGRDTGRGRSRPHAPGARCGIRSRVSRIAPRAKGRR